MRIRGPRGKKRLISNYLGSYSILVFIKFHFTRCQSALAAPNSPIAMGTLEDNWDTLRFPVWLLFWLIWGHHTGHLHHSGSSLHRSRTSWEPGLWGIAVAAGSLADQMSAFPPLMRARKIGRQDVSRDGTLCS